MVSPADDPPSLGAYRPNGMDAASYTEGMLGRLVAGKFEIVELLGSGAMGAVYRAEQVALDKHVALKILHPSLRQDATFVRRFHREAKAAAALEHPNSVSILDFGEEPDGLLYIAMEYLDGRDLFQVIQEEWPLPKERIVALMRQVCGAVARAHDTGVVHRDLKPENIMVMSRVGDDGEPEEVVKVCDFGIAHLQKSPDETGSGKGLLVGTPEYMAPEVARGEEPDGRSDLYALGVVLYQMLTKRLPFEGGDPLRVAMLHVQEEPVPPHQVVANVDSFLEDVALMAMAKSPDRRFGTARQMRGALRAALENREYSAADLSGVLSVLPPNVAARLVASQGLSDPPPAPVSPRIPGSAPVPDLSSLRGLGAPPPATPMGLTVSALDGAEAERLDTGGRHNAEITAEADAPTRSKLPWMMAAAATAVVGLAGFLIVGRTQHASAERADAVHAEPAAASVAPLAAPAAPPSVVVGAEPVSNPGIPVTALALEAPASPAPATAGGSAKAAAPPKASAPRRGAGKGAAAKPHEPDINPDEHEGAEPPTPDAPAPPAAKEPKEAAPPPAKDPAPQSSGLPPTWGQGSGAKESPEAAE